MNIANVLIFIDWDSARRVATDYIKKEKDRTIDAIFKILSENIEKHIQTIKIAKAYNVTWRIYHGWHKGKEKTPDRVEFESYVANATSWRINKTSFSTIYDYGNILLCNSNRMPIFNTLRPREKDGIPEQKMVDTAIACDMMHAIRFHFFDIGVIIADDDDMVPIIFSAEAWEANIKLLTRRENFGKMQNTKGLVERISYGS